MQESALKLAQTQGLWALLFVILLFWVLKQNTEREAKYQEIIEKLADKFETIEIGIQKLNEKIELKLKSGRCSE